MFTLDADGYFVRDGAPFVPVGVNYWPSSCGVEMWPAWPEAEIARDLDVIAGLGLNTVRFFLRWQDFEPKAGVYDPVVFDRLDRLLTLCERAGVVAHPSLFVGWMSGGIFWPDWKRGRNAFADADMTDRAAAFAAAATGVIARHRDNVLSIDQGNELCCLPDSYAATPAEVTHWCGRVNDAVRGIWPDCLIVSGNEQTQVCNDRTSWRLGHQPGCDFYSMHGYPVPNWHPVGFDGMTDPFAQTLLPLYTQIAQTFGPVMVQEFGTLMTAGTARQDAYLRGMLPAAWEAGANGFLFWALRDITARVHPYVRYGFEETLGLIDGAAFKPGLAYFGEFVRTLPTRPRPTHDGDIGLYLPKHYYARDEPANPGNTPRATARGLAMANYHLRRLGRRPTVVRGDLPLPSMPGTLVIAGAVADMDEVIRLAAWVEAGGRLVWHGPAFEGWGSAMAVLVGAYADDLRPAANVTFHFADADWMTDAFPGNTIVHVEATTARVLSADARGMPVVLLNHVGRGAVLTAIAKIDEASAAVAADRAARDRWTDWYRAVLEVVEGRRGVGDEPTAG